MSDDDRKAFAELESRVATLALHLKTALAAIRELIEYVKEKEGVDG